MSRITAITSAMLAIAMLVMPLRASAAHKITFADESLNYEIVYHWGLIWKHAASATLSLTASGSHYNSRLAARTVSWADKIYRVRDTLSCQMLRDGLKPLRYVKATHEKKYIDQNIVSYTYTDTATLGKCIVIRPDRDTVVTNLSARGPVYDMVSVYYYLRTLDFDAMGKGGSTSLTIFSGKRKENLKITYIDRREVKLRDKSRHEAYYIRFAFTQEGGKKSSDDIETWISTDERRIPLMLIGKLPIGEVRCYYAAQ